MRRRLRNFLPIVLIALMAQILAPIGACWAASMAAADPLHTTPICSWAAAPAGQADPSGNNPAHDGSCSMCCIGHLAVSIDTPEPTAVTTPYRQPERVVWFDSTPDLSDSKAGRHAQARAPPSFS